MRPVNLIPLEQRRGAARMGSRRSPLPSFILIGVLGAGVLCAAALVLTGNQIDAKRTQLAELEADEQGARQVVDALRPYGQFAAVQSARISEIERTTKERIDWERLLTQLSKAVPRNVWLIGVGASVKPGAQLEAGGDAANLREETPAPAFALTGCAFSQRSVARTMVRMRNLDGVTRVRLAKSAKRDGQDSSGGSVSTEALDNGDSEDCIGSQRVTKFEVLVEFGGLQTGASAAAAEGVPQGSAAPLGQAEAAATQASGATTAPAGAGE